MAVITTSTREGGMGWRVGVDVGGSFTDFAALDEADGRLVTLKVFSRPDAPGAEIEQGLGLLATHHGVAPEAVTDFTHGTTVGINTVIQRNGVRLALLTTEGFEDVLEMARLKVPRYHNLYARRPDPLVPRARVFGLDGRIRADGRELAPVTRERVAAAYAAARAAGAEAVVIGLLHAWRNDAHERAVETMLAELDPALPVFRSSGIWPIIREYERSITACISGYVQPRVAHYLDRFAATLSGLGVPAAPRITKSNGGVMGLAQARAECVQMILSGTASGVIGAGFIARACGFPRLLTLDIGGTSADLAVLVEGEAEYGSGEVIGDFQIHIPSVSVTSIGQGGGSIAWVDDFGVLQVGPRSAGSTPGPACYGKGGTEPTITDAVAVLGLIGHSDLGYSAVRLDVAAARAAVARLAARLGTGLEETAASILELSVSAMYADASGLISRFGLDARAFRMLAFGGAGPMLACFLARELNLAGVVVPPTPGVLSALGGLVADLRNDVIRTLWLGLEPGAEAALREALVAMQREAHAWLVEEQGFGGTPVISLSAEMRYRGQSFEVETPLEPGWIEAGDLAALREAFHARHERLHGHADREGAVQIVSLRLVVTGETPKPVLPRLAEAAAPARAEAVAEAWLDGARRPVPLYAREGLRAGHTFPGPAIIAQPDSTTCVPAGFGVVVDGFGNLVITPEGR
ncbi:hydantoinase/oxoprolinase family protein [Roseomonas sp. E05]|uniref:hydantoinase/oxoprolinase family protein n=1 Tax=Roseomonas sp. E05 TaxID=3046310 RepID=UPI0024BB999F|nr:hydantoinase/oxoprolinase family protein [Roseomonas sp. E05]MDJ0389062.1 hydantoinase/oxoprolinase family protein [Roseomonas sp. E05]